MKGHRFAVGDEVWLYIPGRSSTQELYIISRVLGNEQYRLCSEDGSAWSSGEVVSGDFLTFVD